MNNSVISVKEARKLLGKKFKDMPDEDVEFLVSRLDSIARTYVSSTGL